MKTIQTIPLFILVILSFSCSEKKDNKNLAFTDGTGSVEDKYIAYSDDSLIMAYWWDTGNGGTAPDIEARCRFKTEEGKIVEEKRPLLRLVYPDYDYGHREVERIASIVTPYGQRVYFFYLWAKVGSNEHEHDLVAFCIDGDSLVPANIFLVEGKYTPHVCLNTIPELQEE